MNPKIALARLSRAAGIADLAPADIAHAAGYVRHPMAVRLALYLWADHKELHPVIVADLCAWAQHTQPQVQHCRALAEQALREHLAPRRCGPCGGTGREKGSPVGDMCPRCDGAGVVPMSDSARSHAAGLHHTTWFRHALAQPYQAIQGRISALEGLALGRIARALRNDEGQSEDARNAA